MSDITTKAASGGTNLTPSFELARVRDTLPVRNQVIFKKGRELNLANHSSYRPASEIQLRGRSNPAPCGSCVKGNGPFEGGCISFGNEDGVDGKAPFKGVCGNCFWGGQGYRCSLRSGGGTYIPRFPRTYTDRSKVSPRSRRAPAVPILQTGVYSNVHVGDRHDMSSADGVRSALEEVESVRRALQQRLRALERGDEVEGVDSEGSSVDGLDEEEEEDDEGEIEVEDEEVGLDMGEEESDEESSFEGFSD